MTIRVNYDNVFRQAAILQRLGEEHHQAAAALDAQRGALAAAWQDPAGAAYAAADAHLAGQMRASADELVRLGALIRTRLCASGRRKKPTPRPPGASRAEREGR